ncbi:uncharacterized protein LOC100906805 [Galendromus occidentalis]|uniref:Peptidyl-prolyl cis-trans isomerase n=1 Tax=Galendromus occidentalis TaxID=34638 RepID=A0AAJ6QVH8_9ACAR|nr:uncharacterized protein LOC100906805 [Galendromus occidentalis]
MSLLIKVVEVVNGVICDKDERPFQDIMITHTVILDDPFAEPENLEYPASPEVTLEMLKSDRIACYEDIAEYEGRTAEEIEEALKEKEAKARATVLEIIGDLPDADMAPPENVLFVCKLNPVTNDDDLELIFSRFGEIRGCEIIRDRKTGESLQYAFIEFANKESCEHAYFKMDNVLIDDRRIHVDFSQSVAKVKWKGKGRGVKGDWSDARKSQKRERSRSPDNRHRSHRKTSHKLKLFDPNQEFTDLDHMAGQIKAQTDVNDVETCSVDEIECSIAIQRLHRPEHSLQRLRALNTLETRPCTTFDELINDLKTIENIRRDAAFVGTNRKRAVHKVELEDTSFTGKCFVTDKCSLLGLGWLRKDPHGRILNLKFISNAISQVTKSPSDNADEMALMKKIKAQYPEVIEGKMGTCLKYEAVILLKMDAKLLFKKIFFLRHPSFISHIIVNLRAFPGTVLETCEVAVICDLVICNFAISRSPQSIGGSGAPPASPMSTPTGAKVLFEDSKSRLADKVQSNVNGLGSLARQILKGARTQQTLANAAKNFAAQDGAINNSEMNLSKMQTLVASMQLQTAALQRNVQMIPELKQQMEDMRF